MTYTINSNSIYLIDIPGNVENYGPLATKVKKIVNIDFSETTYTVKTKTDKTSNDIEVELIPKAWTFYMSLRLFFLRQNMIARSYFLPKISEKKEIGRS